ncbi:MAG: hypothetical protein RL168_33 [Bacteroidota bacterium]|jgi:lipid-A-disaccharide synthase
MAVKKVFVLAGEASGDVLGAEFLSALIEAQPDVQISYTGGPAIQNVLGGSPPLVPLHRMAFMGFAEVIRHVPDIWRNDRRIKAHVKNVRPDLIVLVDYPGYNLRLAKWLDRQGFRRSGTRVVQVVCPQFWAWKPGRLALLKAHLDAVYPLLPFEAKLLVDAGVQAPYSGHPAAKRVQAGGWEVSGPLAILPGSRTQEFAHHVPVFAETARRIGRKAHWFRPAHISEGDYLLMLRSHGVKAEPSDLQSGVPNMSGYSAALVASGTATLEVALRGIPMVVAYKTSALSYAIGKRVIRVPYISLVNLILDRPAVAECIQSDCQPEVLVSALQSAMRDLDWPNTVRELRDAVDLGDPFRMIAHHAAQL